ncbi:MAG TPA: NifB/NifX family molybdenum-iron cluster-binding protein [Bacteroidales bacterium]|jgi:predicted Fe-Mo cluster-binding NifX family protein|nr:NifB/NifX family molybdenum-iron cluster-binding protein [Bacteroidales bacterium]HQA87295.1 NifB/NifX family molybdenum-iron cluster-binding protein [Bacteroidales bacterium]
MKIAITSVGNSLSSNIDERFGRCAFFVIYDTDTKSVEFIPNHAKDAEGGAGTAAVQLIASQQVAKVVSGQFGVKVKPLLDSLKIQMISIKGSHSVQEIINMIEER